MRVSIILALVAALLFGAATPLSKLLLGSINPFLLAGLLYCGAALALAPRALHGGLLGRLRALSRRNVCYIFGSIVGGGILGPVCLLFGLSLAKSASVSLWLNLELVATALLGHFIFKDRMTRASAGATAGILAASVLLSFDGGRTSLAGGALIAAACLAWGFDNHCTALIDGLKPEESTFIKGLVAGGTNLTVGLLVAGSGPPSWAGYGLALGIGALSYGASIVLYIAAAQGLGASRAQLFFSSSPLFGLLLAFVVLGESFSLAQGGALTLMLLSYLLLLSERHGHGHVHAAARHTHWHRHGEGHHEHGHLGQHEAGHDGLEPLARLFGHSHDHEHQALEHEHVHVSDIHHRHGHP